MDFNIETKTWPHIAVKARMSPWPWMAAQTPKWPQMAAQTLGFPVALVATLVVNKLPRYGRIMDLAQMI